MLNRRPKLGALARAALLPLALAILALPARTEAQPALGTERRGTPAGTEEDPYVAFRLAENTFHYQDYERAVELLSVLLYPEVRLKEAEELKAREYLGASHWWLKRFEQAEEELTALLIRQPEYELDAFYYPAALIAFFDGLREKLVRLGVITRELPSGPTAPPDGTERPLVSERIVTKRSLILCFVPFGAGQFQNGHTGKGIAFLVSESALLATNIASFFVIESLREDSGFIAPQNIDTARNFEIVLYTSLGAFAALAVAGIVDALVFYEPQEEVIREIPLDDDSSGVTGSLAPRLGRDTMGFDFQLQF